MHTLAIRRCAPVARGQASPRKRLAPARSDRPGAARAARAVEGSDPPSPRAWYGRGAMRVFTRLAPRPRGRSPPSIPAGRLSGSGERGGESANRRGPLILGTKSRPSHEPTGLLGLLSNSNLLASSMMDRANSPAFSMSIRSLRRHSSSSWMAWRFPSALPPRSSIPLALVSVSSVATRASWPDSR